MTDHEIQNLQGQRDDALARLEKLAVENQDLASQVARLTLAADESRQQASHHSQGRVAAEDECERLRKAVADMKIGKQAPSNFEARLRAVEAAVFSKGAQTSVTEPPGSVKPG
jgi:predicted  nucleic acid-binding Zn-ribbon protein